MTLRTNRDVVTQFDMKGVEKIGLIKFDFPRPQDPDPDQ